MNKTVSLDSDMLDVYAKKYGYGNVSEKIRDAMAEFIKEVNDFMDKDEFITQSKTFEEVKKHRHNCSKWEKGEQCVECFGGGLTRFVDNLAKEKIIKRLVKSDK